MERSIKNRFLDYALRAAFRLGRAKGRNDNGWLRPNLRWYSGRNDGSGSGLSLHGKTLSRLWIILPRSCCIWDIL
jgi:hypothetical protein